MGTKHVKDVGTRNDEVAVAANPDGKIQVAKESELANFDNVEIKTNQVDLEKAKNVEKSYSDVVHHKIITYIYLLEVYVSNDDLINSDEPVDMLVT